MKKTNQRFLYIQSKVCVCVCLTPVSEAKPPTEDTTLKELIPEHVKTFLINAVARTETIIAEIRNSRMGELTR